MKNKGVMVFWAVLAVLIIGSIGWSVYAKFQPGKYDALAQCMKDNGVVFYGAFWCPHCQATKKQFGNSEKLLPYVECSTPDGQSQTQICIDKGVKQYPTWTRPSDTMTISGEHTMQELSDFSGCPLPN